MWIAMRVHSRSHGRPTVPFGHYVVLSMHFVIIVIASSQPPNSLQIIIEAQQFMDCYCGSMRSVGSRIAGWQYWLRGFRLGPTKWHEKKQTFQFECRSGSVFAGCVWENETMQRSSRYSHHQIWLVRAFVSLVFRTRVKFTDSIYIYIFNAFFLDRKPHLNFQRAR